MALENLFINVFRKGKGSDRLRVRMDVSEGCVSAAIPSSTFPNRSVGAYVGQQKLITDIGGAPGTIMLWDGAAWQIGGSKYHTRDVTLENGVASASEQVIKRATLPRGILRSCFGIAVRTLYIKSGVTDAATNVKLRIGTAGTVADAQITSSTVFIASGRSFTTEIWLTPTSATNLRALGNQNGSASTATSAWTTSNMSQTYPKDITVPDIDVNDLIVSATVTMAGATDTPSVAHLLIEMLA